MVLLPNELLMKKVTNGIKRKQNKVILRDRNIAWDIETKNENHSNKPFNSNYPISSVFIFICDGKQFAHGDACRLD